jgi:hypothetical protein
MNHSYIFSGPLLYAPMIQMEAGQDYNLLPSSFFDIFGDLLHVTSSQEVVVNQLKHLFIFGETCRSMYLRKVAELICRIVTRKGGPESIYRRISVTKLLDAGFEDSLETVLGEASGLSGISVIAIEEIEKIENAGVAILSRLLKDKGKNVVLFL